MIHHHPARAFHRDNFDRIGAFGPAGEDALREAWQEMLAAEKKRKTAPPAQRVQPKALPRMPANILRAAIVQIMSDGRERTASDLQAKIREAGYAPSADDMRNALRRLRQLGSVKAISRMRMDNVISYVRGAK